jgi:hypothetical protein
MKNLIIIGGVRMGEKVRHGVIAYKNGLFIESKFYDKHKTYEEDMLDDFAVGMSYADKLFKDERFDIYDIGYDDAPEEVVQLYYKDFVNNITNGERKYTIRRAIGEGS